MSRRLDFIDYATMILALISWLGFLATIVVLNHVIPNPVLLDEGKTEQGKENGHD